MWRILTKIFAVVDARLERPLENAYRQQLRHLKEIWHKPSFGIERVFRLLLCLSQFIFPTLFLRHIFGTFGVTSRKLAVEYYAIIKLLFAFMVLITSLYRYPFVACLVVYFLSETVLHLLHFIFLSDIHDSVISYTRSVLLLFINYLEVLLAFAVIYIGFDLINQPLDPLAAVYYSFVTQATLGYGDYYPKPGAGQLVVIFHLTVVILFVLVFINYFSARAEHKSS